MLTTHYKLNNYTKETWLKNNGHAEDFLVLTEGMFIFLNEASKNIYHGKIILNQVFNHLARAILWFILLPIRISLIIILIPTYFFIAGFFRVYFTLKIRRVKSIYLMIEKKIANKSVSVDKLIEEHTITKKLLNNIAPRLQKLEGEKIMKPALDRLLNEIKKIELIERVAAYPDRNEIVLTYDELIELTKLTDLSF
jgi:hypothetical protein